MTYQRIAIAVSSTRFMRWQDRLRERLATRWPDAMIAFRFDPRDDAQPGAVSQLLTLERMLLRRGKPTLCDRVDTSAANATLESDADVVIDLIGDVSPASGALVLRPLYDGHETDQAAVAAILSGATPLVAVENAATGACIVEGVPSFEAADGLTGGLEAVYSRICVLIEKALAAPETTLVAPFPIQRQPRHPAAFFARNFAFQCARWLYHLSCRSPHWRIGWRYVDGPGVIESGSLSGPEWRVMPDQGGAFSADPFPIEWRGQTGVFYELLDYRTNIGEIFYQPFDASGPVGAPVCALKERWHLSYPFLIEEAGELYMVPEASNSGAITLYRCVAFPDKWEPVANLVEGVEAADATIFRHGGRYWMTSVVRDGYGGYSDTLAIHHAPSLFGPWEPHRKSPVIVDARLARPAGAVMSHNGALLRPVQDCSRGYGKDLAIMRIDALDAENFEQSPVSHLSPGGRWPGGRLHTLNRAGRLECIDGAVFTPKFMPIRRALHDRIDRRLASG
ncbi:glucosamine inositolphosphorylceramide transferase family protein [Methylocystis parvus]|uniref:glucosamine inositolphosphorylceramide transferase family protein n=1 Tax=Methylocystis parvus TaxID=134 RepID=UPI003C74F47E